MTTPAVIQNKIASNLPCEFLEVSGDGQHFEALIISNAFEAKTRIQRHQIVYAALEGGMQSEIHALSMRTWTPAEWSAQKSPRDE